MLRLTARRLLTQRAAPLLGAANFRPSLSAAGAPPLARRYADDAALQKTALYDFHLEMGAKMVRVRRRCDMGLRLTRLGFRV
jgi:hypothetical protein